MTAGSVDSGVVVTAAGYAQLIGELELLRTDARRELSERLRMAREDGDLADNPALFEALEEKAQLEQRIAFLDAQLTNARIAAPATNGVVALGAVVHVRELASGEVAVYQLVGAIEADVASGRLSVDAPIGKALVGRRAGERVDVATPRGTTTIEVLDVAAQMGAAA